MLSAFDKTTQNKIVAFNTPRGDSPLWERDPEHEDASDERTPVRRRTTHGKYDVLLEWKEFRVFLPPEAAAKMRAKGLPPFVWQRQYYIHFRRQGSRATFTYKVYKHRGCMLYDDSTNHTARLMDRKRRPTDMQGRDELCRCLAALAGDGTTEAQASVLLYQWTNGN